MIKDHLKAYTSLTTVCLLWTASTIVKPVYISSRFVLRVIGKANQKQIAKTDSGKAETLSLQDIQDLHYRYE